MALPPFVPYHRVDAVRYAHAWALGRNPAYHDFEALGGDCTSFASQCLFAGCGVMDFTPTFGWYYRSIRDRAPAWTGVEELFRYLTRTADTPGPAAVLAPLQAAEPGDLIQLRLEDAPRFGHTPVVVSAGKRPSPENILVAAHSQDADWRPLSIYRWDEVRLLHITGVAVSVK